jgi:hypothetical protein
MAAAMECRAEFAHRTRVSAHVTVFTYDKAGVPAPVMARAQRIATAAFAAAGVKVGWVNGTRLGELREDTAGEVLTVVFDGPAPADAGPHAMAWANVGGGPEADVRVFYNRVAGRGASPWDPSRTPDVLGNVLAHELTHALQGTARHSREGLMKAVWDPSDFDKMADRPLGLAPVDVALLRARFKKGMPRASIVVPAR